MAKRKQARTQAPKLETLTLRLPRSLWLIINEAAGLAGMKPDDVVRAVLGLGLVRERRERKELVP